MGYIYSITNKINWKRYIGQTIEKNIQDRWKSHFKQNSNCRYLKYALAKYGKENFKFEVILECDDIDLNNRELYYMKYYNTIVPNGYNLREAGNHGRHNEETKRKISQTVKERYSNLPDSEKKALAERQSGINNHNFGKKMSDEQKQKISQNMKNKKPIECYNLDNQLVKTYESISEASKELNGSQRNISKCCLGKGRTAYGFIWKFVK
jgi:group I intron endonuclease